MDGGFFGLGITKCWAPIVEGSAWMVYCWVGVVVVYHLLFISDGAVAVFVRFGTIILTEISHISLPFFLQFQGSSLVCILSASDTHSTDQ